MSNEHPSFIWTTRWNEQINEIKLFTVFLRWFVRCQSERKKLVIIFRCCELINHIIKPTTMTTTWNLCRLCVCVCVTSFGNFFRQRVTVKRLYAITLVGSSFLRTEQCARESKAWRRQYHRHIVSISVSHFYLIVGLSAVLPSFVLLEKVMCGFNQIIINSGTHTK